MRSGNPPIKESQNTKFHCDRLWKYSPMPVRILSRHKDDVIINGLWLLCFQFQCCIWNLHYHLPLCAQSEGQKQWNLRTALENVFWCLQWKWYHCWHHDFQPLLAKYSNLGETSTIEITCWRYLILPNFRSLTLTMPKFQKLTQTMQIFRSFERKITSKWRHKLFQTPVLRCLGVSSFWR